MATQITVKGKSVTRPGVYTDIKSGLKNPQLGLSYGNVCIIDTGGLLSGWAAGSGINGENKSGVNAIYEFEDAQELRDHLKGGYLWLLVEPLFQPTGRGINGVSKVFVVKPATTTQSTFDLSGLANGSITIKTLDEGTGANGNETAGNNLDKGYGLKLISGVLDSNKFIVQFYRGTYRGADSVNGGYYNGFSGEEAQPELLVQTPEMTSLQEFVDWMNSNTQFTTYFQLTASTPTGDFAAADLTTFSGWTLSAGATEVYNATDIDDAIEAIYDVDNTYFLTTDYGDDATSVANTKLFDHLLNDVKYPKYMIVGGGIDSSKFSAQTIGHSLHTAMYYGSGNAQNDLVVVVHGGVYKESRDGSVLKSYDSLYKTFAIAGRISGLSPQVPITLKTIGIDGEHHILSRSEQEFAIEKGILYTYYDYELSSYVIGQGINSLQNNSYLVNEDGSSYSIAVKRIVSQLNKELIYFAKRQFFSGEEGPNRNTVSSNDIVAWMEGFLTKRIASSLEDNLIIRYQNISVTVNQDNYSVSYEFVPNFEVSKIVFTGFILDK